MVQRWNGYDMIRAALALMLAVSIHAQTTEPCTGKCVPPPTWRSERSLPPLDAPLRFGSVVMFAGTPQWAWIRAGDPSRPCTPTQAAATTTTECRAKVGDVLLISPMFRFPKAPRSMMMAAMTEAERVWYGAYRIDNHPGYGRFKRPRTKFVAVRVPRGAEQCIAVLYVWRDGFVGQGGSDDVRLNDTWVILAITSSASNVIAVKSAPIDDRNCGAISSPNVGKWVLPPVDIALLPSSSLEALP